MLKPLFLAVLEEKGNAAKRAFASACASTLKYAKASQTQKIIDDTASLHSGDRNSQISCAILLKNFLNNAADRLDGHHAVVLPVIFVSRFGVLFFQSWHMFNIFSILLAFFWLIKTLRCYYTFYFFILYLVPTSKMIFTSQKIVGACDLISVLISVFLRLRWQNLSSAST